MKDLPENSKDLTSTYVFSEAKVNSSRDSGALEILGDAYYKFCPGASNPMIG